MSGLCGRKVIGWNWDGHVLYILVLQATNASMRRPGEGRRVDGKLEGRCYEQLLCSNEEDHSIEMEGEWLLGKRGTVLLIIVLVGGKHQL